MELGRLAPDDLLLGPGAPREVHRRFSTIEVDRLRVKPTVIVAGEFYLQTVEGAPNYNIHSWLEAEGARGVPAAAVIVCK